MAEVKGKAPKSKEFISSFGNKFMLQRVRASEWIAQMDRMQKTDQQNKHSYAYLLSNVVVTPSGLTMDDFDDRDEYNGFAELLEVAEAARSFQLNNK